MFFQNHPRISTHFSLCATLLLIASVVAAAPSSQGDIAPIAAPASVVPGLLQSNTDIFIFRERSNFILPFNLNVDITQPGDYYDPAGAVADPLTPSVIPAGTRVDVYFVHQDTPGGAATSLSGGVGFNPEEILGVIVLSSTLETSDSIVGHPLTAYPIAGTAPYRGVESLNAALPGFDDQVRVGPTMHWLKVRWETESSPDQMRIITTPQG